MNIPETTHLEAKHLVQVATRPAKATGLTASCASSMALSTARTHIGRIKVCVAAVPGRRRTEIPLSRRWWRVVLRGQGELGFRTTVIVSVNAIEGVWVHALSFGALGTQWAEAVQIRLARHSSYVFARALRAYQSY